MLSGWRLSTFSTTLSFGHRRPLHPVVSRTLGQGSRNIRSPKSAAGFEADFQGGADTHLQEDMLSEIPAPSEGCPSFLIYQ